MIVQGCKFQFVEGVKKFSSFKKFFTGGLDETREYLCTDCSFQMHLSKSMIEYIKEPNVKVDKFQCMECAFKELENK